MCFLSRLWLTGTQLELSLFVASCQEAVMAAGDILFHKSYMDMAKSGNADSLKVKKCVIKFSIRAGLLPVYYACHKAGGA